MDKSFYYRLIKNNADGILVEVSVNHLFTNEMVTKEITMTEKNFKRFENYYYDYTTVNIQDALYFLSDDDREFLKTGLTPLEWNNITMDGTDYLDEM